MDPRRLLTFRIVARQTSFSRAAEQLALTQPSISNQIAALETEVGLRLIDRNRGGLRLTAAGELLLIHADEIAWRLQLADSQLAALAAKQLSTLRIGAFPTALAELVPTAVSHLRASHKHLRVLLSEVTPDEVNCQILSGDCDVCVSYQDATAERREIRGVRRIDLLHDTFMIGLPLSHRLADHQGPLSLTQLAHESWILASTDGFLVQACRELGVEPQIAAITKEPLATGGLIARGLGVGLIPSFIANQYTGITIKQIKENIRSRDIYALLPPGRRHPHAQSAIDALVFTADTLQRSSNQ